MTENEVIIYVGEHGIVTGQNKPTGERLIVAEISDPEKALYLELAIQRVLDDSDFRIPKIYTPKIDLEKIQDRDFVDYLINKLHLKDAEELFNYLVSRAARSISKKK